MNIPSDGWFDHVFVEENYLRTPPPVAAQAVVEKLCRNYHLQEKSLHVIWIPCLRIFLEETVVEDSRYCFVFTLQ